MLSPCWIRPFSDVTHFCRTFSAFLKKCRTFYIMSTNVFVHFTTLIFRPFYKIDFRSKYVFPKNSQHLCVGLKRKIYVCVRIVSVM